jgi:hypothetical protein
MDPGNWKVSAFPWELSRPQGSPKGSISEVSINPLRQFDLRAEKGRVMRDPEDIIKDLRPPD